MPNILRLHRVIATKPKKVYRAFLEADAVASWLPPMGSSARSDGKDVVAVVYGQLLSAWTFATDTLARKHG